MLLGLLLLSGCAGSGAGAPELSRLLPENVGVPPLDAVESGSAQTDAPEITAPEPTETVPVEPSEETEAPAVTEAPEPTEPPVDTEPPFFLYFVSTATLEQGKAFDVHRYISYIDDLDAEVELTVEGSVDPGTLGDYPVRLTLTDDAGNACTQSMTVRVVKPAESVDPPTPSTPPSFADFTAAYRKDDTMVGIDVSKWQGDIDFEKVAAAGCEFVIIRIGGFVENPFEDSYFAANLKNAKAAGLKVGVYWYSEENGAAQVHENAAYLYSLLDGVSLDFPVFFDWEDYSNIEDYRMSLRDFNEMFLAFRAEAEAHGYQAALYNSKFYLGLLWSEEVKQGGVWLAHYIDQTNYEGSYFLWQQGIGRIDGINGDVDVDVFYPDRLSN